MEKVRACMDIAVYGVKKKRKARIIPGPILCGYQVEIPICKG
jgi:hypothetical protein